MSSPTQVSSSNNLAPLPLLRRRANMMHTLPPVFSPEHSPPPPMGFPSRTAYLPLISPAITEEEKSFDFSTNRRGSTPTLAKSSASQYFEELRKRRRTSETSVNAPTSTTSTQQPVFMHEKVSHSSGKFAELPSSIAQSILRALELQAKASTSAIGTTTALLKKRTMSMPSARPDENFELGREDKRQRRASMRSQQLALLASQARLARTGATSVEKAIRAERAVEGAVRQVVKEAQAGGNIKELSSETSAELDGNSDEVSPTDVRVEMRDATSAWSEALATPHKATAFLSSASEVAHDWANGFYRFEEEWAEDALNQEKRRLSEHQIGSSKRLRRESNVIRSPLSPEKAVSAPSTRESSPVADTTTEVNADAPESVRSSLVAAHKRLSASLPSVPTFNKNKMKSNEGGGQLVDVLTNFANLIGQRKEVCHGLEKLAQDAKSLSSVPLPSVSSSLSQQIPVIDEEGDIEDSDDDKSA